MADSVPLIDAAIYSRLGTVVYTYPTGSGTAMYSGSVPVVNTLALQQTLPPYIVFQLQTGIPEYAFAGDEGESFDYLVKAVSLRNFPSQESNPIFEKASITLQDAPLSVAGYSVLRVRRGSRVRYRDQQGYWHVGAIFRIDIVRT